MSNPTAYLHKIATVVPEKYYTQEFALDFLLRLMGDTPSKQAFLTKIYQGSAIYKRHSVITDYDQQPEHYQFYPKNASLLPEPDTKTRNDIFIREANRLSLLAAEKLLASLPEVDRQRITHLITVSCTGFSAPGFDLHLVKSLPLAEGVHRFHLGFMGCCAAFPAMKLARDICLAHPAAKVLVINTELCSVHFQQKYDLDVIVANALFADGISAALISADPADSAGNKIVLHDFLTRVLPDSEGEMAWSIGRHGFDMRLSAYVPRVLDLHMLPVMKTLLQQANIRKDEIALWAIHPGGKAILEKLEKTMALTKEDLASSYEVLWDFGNMSSATIMFVLQNILEHDRCGKIFSAGFGPGLTLETGYFEKISG